MIFINAIKNTFNKRNTKVDINNFSNVIDMLKNDDNMKKLWDEYSNRNSYAKNTTYNDTIKSLNRIVEIIKNNYNL